MVLGTNDEIALRVSLKGGPGSGPKKGQRKKPKYGPDHRYYAPPGKVSFDLVNDMLSSGKLSKQQAQQLLSGGNVYHKPKAKK